MNVLDQDVPARPQKLTPRHSLAAGRHDLSIDARTGRQIAISENSKQCPELINSGCVDDNIDIGLWMEIDRAGEILPAERADYTHVFSMCGQVRTKFLDPGSQGRRQNIDNFAQQRGLLHRSDDRRIHGKRNALLAKIKWKRQAKRAPARGILIATRAGDQRPARANPFLNDGEVVPMKGLNRLFAQPPLSAIDEDMTLMGLVRHNRWRPSRTALATLAACCRPPLCSPSSRRGSSRSGETRALCRWTRRSPDQTLTIAPMRSKLATPGPRMGLDLVNSLSRSRGIRVILLMASGAITRSSAPSQA